MWAGLVTDRINNKVEKSNLINDHAHNRQPIPLYNFELYFLSYIITVK